MRDLGRNVLAAVFMVALFVTLAYAFGFSLDGVLYGQWPDTSDHPTNWNDTALHP